RPERGTGEVGGAARSGGGDRGDHRLARRGAARRRAGPGPRAAGGDGRGQRRRRLRRGLFSSQPGSHGRTSSMTSTAKAQTGETPTARQRRVWDKSAPSYDKQIAFFEKIQFGGGREWLGERAHGRVLEVAIGTGLNLSHYAADTTMTGVELSPAML